MKYEKKKSPLYNINTRVFMLYGGDFFFHISSFIFVIECQIPVMILLTWRALHVSLLWLELEQSTSRVG